MKVHITLAALLLLAGCDTTTVQQSRYIPQAMPQRPYVDPAVVAHQHSEEVCNAAYATPGLAPIMEKLPEDASKPSLQQLADKSKPNLPQKNALLLLDQVSGPCNDAVMAEMRLKAPGVAEAYAALLDQRRGALAKLYSGEMTFGAYNTARESELVEFRTASARAEQQQAQTQEQRRQAAAQVEAAQAAARAQQAAANAARAAAAAQILQATRPVYQPPAYSPPVTTNCNRFGNTVNCTSY